MRHKLSTPHGAISLVSDGRSSSRTHIVLAHGAGADLNSPFMAAMAEDLTLSDLVVWRFNFRYAEQRRKSPDSATVLEETFRHVVAHVAEADPSILVLGGKSMGGRIAAQIVAGGVACDGLVFLGYPLHPPGKPERLRDAPLLDAKAPMLFVEGTRDPFCPLETLEQVRAKLVIPSDLVVIDDGDHSFKVRKSSGRTTEEAWAQAAASVADWVTALPRA